MARFSEWIELLGHLLGAWGVPVEYTHAAAMALIFLVATLAVVLLLLLLFRIRRGRPEPPSTFPPAGEDTASGREELPHSPETGTPVENEEAVSERLEKFVPPVEVGEKSVPREVAVPETPAPSSLWDRMRSGLAKTRSALAGPIDLVLSGKARLSQDLLDELEEVLVTADFGINTTQKLIGSLQQRFSGTENVSSEAIRDCLQENIVQLLGVDAPELDVLAADPFVIMIVGVNGAGKTTSIGKLAYHFQRAGRSVLLGAGDTFRAAAADQLAIWGERTGADVIRQQEGSDPAAVAFDTAKAALKRGAQVVLLDTAGRLHTKTNLMEEIKKIQRILGREVPGAPHETLLVLDATTGQNALSQARLFREALNVSGVILTKLDGTAKGGVVVPIAVELGLPVRFVGIGEGMEDLRPFDPGMFARALFSKE